MHRRRYPRITIRLGMQRRKTVVALQRAGQSTITEEVTEQAFAKQTETHLRRRDRDGDRPHNLSVTKVPCEPTQPYYQQWQPVNFSQAADNRNQQLALLGNLVKEGVDLSGIQLEQICLNEIDLSHASLLKANFRGAMLLYANLSNALLVQADLSGAALFHANLCNANLLYANLRGADLTGADLTGADLTGADLTGCLIRGSFDRETRLCQTILPDGKVSNRDCFAPTTEDS